MKQITMLVVLDGFGYNPKKEGNAIALAKKPHLDAWMKEYPHTLLQASGEAVGCPKGFIGSSETGHKTIGAGRRVREAITKINDAIESGEFFDQQILVTSLKQLAQSGKTLHIMGLFSDAGVHSDLNHLFAFLEVAKKEGVKSIALHAFLDGRDALPRSAATYLQQVTDWLDKNKIGKICSLHGRLFAMDRDNNWDRVKKTYDVLTSPTQSPFTTWKEALDYYYKTGISDEFIPPTSLCAPCSIHDGDGIIFFNYRADRARELTAAFVDPSFKEFETKKLNLAFFITPTEYSIQLHTTVLYPTTRVDNTLKEVLAQHGKSIFTIAETEKYAHVTYFFNGGKEQTLLNETRHLIPSNHEYVTYEQHPEMEAGFITQTVLNSLKTNPADFYLINYANADMVGHSGNIPAAIRAIEYLDAQLGALYDQVVGVMHGTLYVTADHGNAEEMIDEKTHQPKTSHTTNPVPFIMLSDAVKNKKIALSLKELGDIAPFILKNMNLPIPPEMKR